MKIFIAKRGFSDKIHNSLQKVGFGDEINFAEKKGFNHKIFRL